MNEHLVKFWLFCTHWIELDTFDNEEELRDEVELLHRQNLPTKVRERAKRRAAASWCSMSSRPTGIMPATAPAGVRRSENTVSARPCMPSFGRGTRIFLLGVKRICIALLLWKLHKASDTFCSRTPGFLGYMGRTEL